ncbi:UPF0662 protein C30C2.08 [Golovinomyces cichoracearum]|uniref:UPF0662 protein C30C2.08 n=1 Tax=Golovinomyces cichoracearum TaxID=62708 RepID=A0A420HK70_9PEZI|nr:UPF0662 protein C30C2.08 [Golovinomyces cichoracearum]
MTNTLTLSCPPEYFDMRELSILEGLQRVRDELKSLKQDRSTYIKSPDIIFLYDRTVEQVQLLNDARIKNPKEQNQALSDALEVDRMLDCCLQLLSLFFMTIGRNNEAPVAYALTSTVRCLLDHSIEADLHSSKVLAHISLTLERLREVVKTTSKSYTPKLIALLMSRIEICQSLLTDLQGRLLKIHEDLRPVHEKLISIMQFLSSTNTRTNFPTLEIQQFQNQLVIIDDQRIGGRFVGSNGRVLDGSEIVETLLEKCHSWSQTALERKGKIPEEFKHTYKILLAIRDRLAKLSFTQAWSLREADLYDYQRKLDKIDGRRINGNFLDADGNPADIYVKRTFLYLIRRSYSYIYYLMVSSEPISEGLLPIYNQLQTLRQRLTEVKNSGGVSSPRELYPYNLKLQCIESMRIDGKFFIENEIPEGQADVIELLEQCYELKDELRLEIEENNINSPSGRREINRRLCLY